jgi:hypothetical protein
MHTGVFMRLTSLIAFAALTYAAMLPLGAAEPVQPPRSVTADDVRVRGDSAPQYFNRERAFWMSPGWSALEQYAEYLKTRPPAAPASGPWPRDEALERMKAHLALGIYGPRPAPYADWASLKRKAQQYAELDRDVRRLKSAGSKPAPDTTRDALMPKLAGELERGIGIWGPLHDSISADGGAVRVAQLVNALEFPTAAPSLFRSASELAPPGTSAEEASGRFGIVFRQLVSKRSVPSSPEGGSAGLYDMLGRTQVLVRPVQRVQLFSDGRLSSEPSLLRTSETLWRDVDEPMCGGWTPGFSFGAAERSIWRYFGNEAPAQEKENRNPAGSLFAFYTTMTLPAGPARRVETALKMDRDATGFVQGTHRHFDIDGDGIADLSIWEGQGKGPGHLEGMTTTDDRWYRLALVNIGGAWKVLGSDIFGYGCGC